MTHPMLRRRAVAALTLVAALWPAQAAAQEGEEVTFNRDVMPILQANCQECHQPNSIAPMSLLSYRDAYRWGSRIREKVSERIMPPWHIDRTVGIQDFENDRGLTEEELETLLGWIDGGTPYGDALRYAKPYQPVGTPMSIAWTALLNHCCQRS